MIPARGYRSALPRAWRYRLRVFCAALALLPSACSDDAPVAAPHKGAEAAAEMKGAAAAQAGELATENYSYNAIGKRDPFRTYFAEVDEVDDAAGKNLTPLQYFEIDQLRLVAVIVGTATPTAMVEDPGGVGHIVRVGTLIGKRWGQVRHVRRCEIIVQEEFRDFTGRRVSHLVPIKVPDCEREP